MHDLSVSLSLSLYVIYIYILIKYLFDVYSSLSWETFAPKVSILRGMVAICGVCVRYAVNMGSGWGSQSREHMEVEGNWESPGPTSNQ